MTSLRALSEPYRVPEHVLGDLTMSHFACRVLISLIGEMSPDRPYVDGGPELLNRLAEEWQVSRRTIERAMKELSDRTYLNPQDRGLTIYPGERLKEPEYGYYVDEDPTHPEYHHYHHPKKAGKGRKVPR